MYLRRKLWWPNGLGDPYLYRASVSLIAAGRALDTIEFDYGIRTIRRLPSAGPKTQDRWDDWQFVVNDRKFFVKGMDWWTNDIFLDLPRDRYEWSLKSAQAAGIQLLRTWGGGIVETNDFYELCDQLGILVWQDFPIGNRQTGCLAAGYLAGDGDAESLPHPEPSFAGSLQRRQRVRSVIAGQHGDGRNHAAVVRRL